MSALEYTVTAKHDFISFPKITRSPWIHITQKLHGTNGQLLITDDGQVHPGSRNRWLTDPNDKDNFGFGHWARENATALAAYLGPGRWFGEWCGPGIGSGEGLAERAFCLFDWRADLSRDPALRPADVLTVPLLYCGHDLSMLGRVDEYMLALKHNGSKLVPGFMRPEGVVVCIDNHRIKMTFAKEDVPWNESSGTKGAPSATSVFVDSYLHLVRMQKVVAEFCGYTERDELHTVLPEIVSCYLGDLSAEGYTVPGALLGSVRAGAFKLAKHVISQVRADAALDELTRETEALGLYEKE